MKAWFVWVDDEWGDYVHGETANKAKSMFWNQWGLEADEWIQLRPIRYPRLDNVPITSESILEGYDEDQREEYGGWKPICECRLCKRQTTI